MEFVTIMEFVTHYFSLYKTFEQGASLRFECRRFSLLGAEGARITAVERDVHL